MNLGGYELRRDEFEALARAARTLGDDGFYLTRTECGPDEVCDYWIRLAGWDFYESVRVGAETALYSPQAAWGLLISHVGHAVAAGQGGFATILADNLPDDFSGRSAAVEFVSNYASWGLLPKMDWLPDLLAWAFGAADAQLILSEGEAAGGR